MPLLNHCNCRGMGFIKIFPHMPLLHFSFIPPPPTPSLRVSSPSLMVHRLPKCISTYDGSLWGHIPITDLVQSNCVSYWWI